MRTNVQRKLLLIGLILIASLSTSCATTTQISSCLPLVNYDREVKRQLANEVEMAPDGAVFTEFVKDYKQLRGMVRAACDQ